MKKVKKFLNHDAGNTGGGSADHEAHAKSERAKARHAHGKHLMAEATKLVAEAQEDGEISPEQAEEFGGMINNVISFLSGLGEPAKA